jgi:hypothetical protein
MPAPTQRFLFHRVVTEEAEAGMSEMSKVYDGAEGAQAPDANERSEDKPGARYIWALVIGSTTDCIAARNLLRYM